MLVRVNLVLRSSIDKMVSMGLLRMWCEMAGCDFMLKRWVLPSRRWMGPWLRSYAIGASVLDWNCDGVLPFEGVR